MSTSRLVLVGGFLGSGKTTLLGNAAARLTEGGQRVGLVTNDQAHGLVDTRRQRARGFVVEEVAGSCFCCDFDGLASAINSLRGRAAAEVILAEPVGSCTDLMATIVRPLASIHPDIIMCSPLSVVVDPQRLRQSLGWETQTLHPDAMYLLWKQLQEARVIVLNKIDLLSSAEIEELVTALGSHFTQATIFPVSAEGDRGIEAWLRFVLEFEAEKKDQNGFGLEDLDYGRYAAAEGRLAWLNLTGEVNSVSRTEDRREFGSRESGEVVDWRVFAGDLVRALAAQVDRTGGRACHVKALFESGGNVCVAGLAGDEAEIYLVGNLPNGTGSAKFTLNARVEGVPEDLSDGCHRAIASACSRLGVSIAVESESCFSPAEPHPTYRFMADRSDSAHVSAHMVYADR